MLDYKDIITKHYALGMSGRKIAESLKVSKSGVNDFLRAFQECPVLSYPLPEGITNYGIAILFFGNLGIQDRAIRSDVLPLLFPNFVQNIPFAVALGVVENIKFYWMSLSLRFG